MAFCRFKTRTVRDRQPGFITPCLVAALVLASGVVRGQAAEEPSHPKASTRDRQSKGGAVIGAREREEVPPVFAGERPVRTSPQPADPADSEPIVPLTAAEIQAAIGELASDRFDAREAATKKLAGVGFAAIAPLTAAAQVGSLEVTCRAIRALEAIGRKSDAATFETVQTSLEHLAASKSRSVARRAGVALDALSDARQRHALARIVELGGVLKRPILNGARAAIDDVEVADQIVINRNWKGGDEGLVYLRRISMPRTVYVTKSAKVSREALDAIRQELPELMIQSRGDAMLGVQCSSNEGRCVVYGISPKSAAERCGLRVGDTIISYDGKELTNFDQLIEITGKHQPGDKVLIEVIRDGKPLEEPLRAELDDWQ